jgi:membrane-associated phospholipid phosphatase
MRTACLTLLALLAAAPARAEELRPLRHDLELDVAVTGGGLGLLLLGTLAREQLGPLTCSACAPNDFDERARNALLWNYTATARSAAGTASALLALGVGAEVMLVANAHGDPRAGLVDLLVITEAVTLALDAGLVLQHATGRQRPFVHFGNFPEPVHVPSTADNLSFPAGQATFAFSLATAAGTVAFLRGWRYAPWVLGLGLGVATVVGYLRRAGDMNYATDVIAGAALGGAAGFAIPWFFHQPEEGERRSAVRLVPAPGGLALLF